MTADRPKLSKSEWELMNLCWELGRATAREIYEASLKKKKRDYQTVKTLLDRMGAKGFLKVEKQGPLCIFTPAVKRTYAVTSAIDEFIETVLDKSLAPLFIHLAKDRRLSEEEIEKLKQLIQERENESERESRRKEKGQ
jgi:BlaI family penicillinase repressor